MRRSRPPSTTDKSVMALRGESPPRIANTLRPRRTRWSQWRGARDFGSRCPWPLGRVGRNRAEIVGPRGCQRVVVGRLEVERTAAMVAARQAAHSGRRRAVMGVRLESAEQDLADFNTAGHAIDV